MSGEPGTAVGADGSTVASRFNDAKARFFAGLEAYETGRFDAAEAHYLASLAALPKRPSTLINLAATRLELGRPDAALAAADEALAEDPAAFEAWLHRGSALLRLGHFDAAATAFDRLLELDPDCLAGWLQQAQAQERLGRLDAALEAFARALALDPGCTEAWSGRGGLLRELGRPAEAAAAYRAAVQHGGDPALHAYYLAAVAGDDVADAVPDIAPPGYVAALFDDYADEFDAHLVGQLGYRAPEQLVDALPRPAGGRFASALDLGCGTGLCGARLRPLVDRLTGVDLAPRMVAKARERGLYDRLEVDDLVAFLQRDETERFDLVVAADVFIYLGELATVFAAARALLVEGGRFAFTVEALDDDAADADFALLPSLRYAHAERYLRTLATAHRFAIERLWTAPVREDQRRPIDGSFVLLRAA